MSEGEARLLEQPAWRGGPCKMSWNRKAGGGGGGSKADFLCMERLRRPRREGQGDRGKAAILT